MTEFSSFRVLSFDCYGTLIDWEAGILSALRPWRERTGITTDDESLLARYGDAESEVQRTDPGLLYPLVLEQSFHRMATRLDAPPTDAERVAFGRSVPDWPAFPDSSEALHRLQERYKLVILSNVHRAGIAASAERLGVTFDAIVTAEDVGAYKPAHAHFERLFGDVLPSLGVDRSELLHVAQSLFHDHVPAQELSIPSVWIDRRQGKPGSGATPIPAGAVTPRWTFPTLTAFAEAAR